MKETVDVENPERRPRGEEKVHCEKAIEEGDELDAEGGFTATTAEAFMLVDWSCTAPVAASCRGDFVALVV